MVGLLKSIRRPMGTGSRATMRAAPDEPKKTLGFNEPFLWSG
ncbi:hypothetical protein Y11_11511 [Yersinia enterocolitica subsp. palearctica Y11]|uniref:Uncharacterized protein n=1 Tax=Yersinia enterocolitica subsp. palearctica serotype O:3 (strain DSM 13030 / CIP 106945 / Y11) TaxID=930944 RepID=A0A0G2PMW4_YERE1|nr:hypothetical protein Y11_07141 [Yersinia enterocolitica subsp. palearctica Y11]CBY27467.1 hypothetical protein Y11_11511 [Yersinia enterocolitica subsp. palearctica Y11]CCO68473.1 hypothetical protein D322_1599 [Yersinia enterocolitica IP 10393]CCO68882.1 hypothetical protein D322_2008 [Yersinia enterocolitica IP 10393]